MQNGILDLRFATGICSLPIRSPFSVTPSRYSCKMAFWTCDLRRESAVCRFGLHFQLHLRDTHAKWHSGPAICDGNLQSADSVSIFSYTFEILMQNGILDLRFATGICSLPI